MSKEIEQLGFKIHTKLLIEEILESNPELKLNHIIFSFKMFYEKLREVAVRCSQLNDPILNKLMCDLTLYSISDPTNSDYDSDVLNQIEDKFIKAKKELK